MVVDRSCLVNLPINDSQRLRSVEMYTILNPSNKIAAIDAMRNLDAVGRRSTTSTRVAEGINRIAGRVRVARAAPNDAEPDVEARAGSYTVENLVAEHVSPPV